jgi:DNA (cytosine-5)-methyltransferase 1
MSSERLTFGSLFSGIGGIDLGLERQGFSCKWAVEWADFPRSVFEKRFRGVPLYRDASEVDYASLEPVDLIAGGFPCQPVSTAGRRLAQSDDRWLWPQFERAVRELRPRFVLVENVPGLLVRGMGDVLGGLSCLGYDAEWHRISAAEVGAPHLRQRVWIIGIRREVADPDGDQPA